MFHGYTGKVGRAPPSCSDFQDQIHLLERSNRVWTDGTEREQNDPASHGLGQRRQRKAVETRRVIR
jgi:hypothetical protein